MGATVARKKGRRRMGVGRTQIILLCGFLLKAHQWWVRGQGDT